MSKALSHKKLMIINTVLFLGIAALFFRMYLPLTEEITDLNQQMADASKNLEQFKTNPNKLEHSSGKRTVYALPESEVEQLSRQLENLALKHGASLIQVTPDTSRLETVKSLKLQLIPYEVAFSVDSPIKLSQLLAEFERLFPDMVIKTLNYEKNIATIEVWLFTSSRPVRLFSS